MLSGTRFTGCDIGHTATLKLGISHPLVLWITLWATWLDSSPRLLNAGPEVLCEDFEQQKHEQNQ
jgi:hypothetical protein